MARPSAPVRRLALVLLAALLAGCRDAPTMPAALQQLAGGEAWVAIPEPHGLPSLHTWLPLVERSTPDGRAAYERIRDLAARGDRARAEGRPGEAALLQREAQRVAVLSLGRYPDPVVLREALFAVGAWEERVRDQVALERAPEISRALEEVHGAREVAEAQLAAGDTTSAVLRLADAAERIRGLTPTAVALRVLSRAEGELHARPAGDPGVDRALRLLGSARQELLAGDPRRALRRALYALQLAHGNGLPADEEECVGPGC